MARRKSRGRPNPPQIHIYTEGESEVLYLNYLKNLVGVRHHKRLVVKSKRKQGLDLYYYVRKEYRKHDFVNSPTTIILVIDKDDTSTSDLKKLKKLCSESNFTLVFSNACFELWLLLHFERVTANLNREELKKRIEGRTGKKYKKTDKPMFEKIVRRYKQALANSEKMSAEILDFEQNPYTNVGELVKKYFNV